MSEETELSVLIDVRNRIRAATFNPIKALLETALPDPQARLAYQMLDGVASIEQVRVAAKMSPNKLVALTQRWIAMGLMEVSGDKKKRRLFDLTDFELLDIAD